MADIDTSPTIPNTWQQWQSWDQSGNPLQVDPRFEPSLYIDTRTPEERTWWDTIGYPAEDLASRLKNDIPVDLSDGWYGKVIDPVTGNPIPLNKLPPGPGVYSGMFGAKGTITSPTTPAPTTRRTAPNYGGFSSLLFQNNNLNSLLTSGSPSAQQSIPYFTDNLFGF